MHSYVNLLQMDFVFWSFWTKWKMTDTKKNLRPDLGDNIEMDFLYIILHGNTSYLNIVFLIFKILYLFLDIKTHTHRNLLVIFLPTLGRFIYLTFWLIICSILLVCTKLKQHVNVHTNTYNVYIIDSYHKLC